MESPRTKLVIGSLIATIVFLKLLIVSTDSVSEKARQTLMDLTAEDNRNIGDGVYSDEYRYGFHLTLAEPDPDDPIEDESLRNLAAFSRANGITHVRLDADGPPLNIPSPNTDHP